MNGELFPDEAREKAELLKRFMQEHFPYPMFKKMGVFTKDIRTNYEAQATVICEQLGLESIYEYGREETRCHISFAGPRPLQITGDGKLIEEPFITVIPGIYD